VGFDLLQVFAKDGREVAYFLAILLLFRDELEDVMEELADIVLFLNLLVSFAMQGKQFALKYDLDDVILDYTI
jgi:hypothetical protein